MVQQAVCAERPGFGIGLNKTEIVIDNIMNCKTQNLSLPIPLKRSVQHAMHHGTFCEVRPIAKPLYFHTDLKSIIVSIIF